MHKILTSTAVTAVAAAMLTGTFAASAADLRPRAVKAPPYIPPAYYNWTGFYIGVNGGGGWGSSRWDSTAGFNTSGGLIGGTIGYNWQTGPWVLGLEGDLDWSNIGGSTTIGACGGGSCSSQLQWLGTVRGRVGYAFDRVLPYVTGGGAFGDVKASVPGFAGKDRTQAGWTVGAGVEMAIARNWTAKVEYLHVDLGSFNCGLSCGVTATNNVNFTSEIVRGGFNFRF